MGFYSRLKDLKEDADLTQKQVADLIGVSVNHYGKYERGETDIPLEKAIILANYYGVSLDYLAGLTNVKNAKCANQRTAADQLRTLSMYISLSSYNRANVDKYIEKVSDAEKKHK